MAGEKKPVCREKEHRASEPVLICNAGDRMMRFKFDGRRYEFAPKTQKRVPMAVAWHIFGDPDLKPGQKMEPTYGDNRTWGREKERLMHLWGAWKWDPTVDNGGAQQRGRTVIDEDSEWKYIERGHFFCPSLGRGLDYYGEDTAADRPHFVADEAYVEPSRDLPVTVSMRQAREERDRLVADEAYVEPGKRAAQDRAIAMATAAMK